MADVDETPVVATADTGLSTAPQASNDDDVALEDMTFDEADLAGDDDTEDEAEPADTKAESAAEDLDESEAESTDEVTDEAEGSNTDPEAERKRFDNEMAKQRIAERDARQAARQAEDALEAERLRNYLDEAKDDDEELSRRQRNVEAYELQKERADLNTERLQVGIDKALADIDLFRTGSLAVRNRLIDSLDTFEQMYVVKDKAGRPIEVRGDVYQHLAKEAESIRELLQTGATQEAKTKQTSKARAITPPSRAPKTAKVDKDLDDFDKAWGS